MTLDLGIVITIGVWLICDIAWKITTERRLARPQALEAENWALKQALGYPIPADKETINNPFKCGVCDARNKENQADKNWWQKAEGKPPIVTKSNVDPMEKPPVLITHPVDDKGNVITHPVALVSTNDTFERTAEEGKAS